ncbi:MAG TPA: phosphatase PAP2 family protein [candidate division Zixibacteria bacterium]|nr:phosphatase PAP2 family protein [candidate division Zixibacteria bacterium]MDD4916988.1 phosphatase PAP2 family protein [candidate division Zixibacteria bacterium]MDM7972621.1 phosphatase PAP2 family protein [candidate division Zixibacteria bacterium]HOZ08574.1 phosphatase PAP2 family protein [candidate division Zixibacteria bacterium]HPI32002.1 phosphatase PAP2 family protein [candidate division Zixibacteria bacterium]
MGPALSRFYLFDRILFGYCLFMVGLLLAVGRPLGIYRDELLFYSAMALLVLVIAGRLDPARSRFSHALRLLYPVAILVPFYRETGGTMFLFFDHFLDAHLIAFETAVFGQEPTLFIDRHLLHPVLTEAFMFCYFCYYLVIPVFMIAGYLRGRFEVVKSALAAVLLTFAVSYVVFFLFPIEGPRWRLTGQYLHPVVTGYVFTDLVGLTQQYGSVRGGCFPSTHFAVTFVILLFTARYFRRGLWLMAPLTVGLGIGTFWGRYHYVSDVAAGGLIGLAVTLLLWRAAPADRAGQMTEVRKLEAQTPHAS